MDSQGKSKAELIAQLNELQQKYDSLKALFNKDVSGRKKAEASLLESETRFRKVVEQAPIAMAIVSMEGVIEFINHKAIEVFGYLPQDIPNMDIWFNMAYPDEDYREKVIADWMGRVQHAVINGKEIIGNEYQVTCKDGTIKTIFISGVPVTGKIVVLFEDITERKKVEDALSESEERFSKAYMTSPISFMIAYMEDGRIIEVNDAFTTISGYTREEAINNSTINLNFWVNDEDRNQMVATLRKGQTVVCQETKLRAKNGSIATVLLSAQVIQLGKKFCIISSIEDITERKRAEIELVNAKEKAEEAALKLKVQNKEIELNNERLESLHRISQYQASSIQNLLDYALEEAINLTNSKIGYIYFYNETTQQFILNTWSKEVMKECAIENPNSVYDLDKTGCWGEAVRQRKPIIINDYHEENVYKKGTPEGHVKLLKFLTIPVFYDNKIVAVAGVANKITDYNNSDIRQLTLLMDSVWKISERITLTENLKKAKEKAEESDRLKTAFLQNMSHEIRTPMNAIMGFSSLMVENYNNRNKLEKFSEIINLRCNDLLEIISDILDISKIESGQLPVSNEECNLNELFAELTAFFTEHQKRIGKQQLTLSLQALCPPSGNAIITDKVKLRQILINLIGNAFKFTEIGKIEGGCKFDANQNLIFYVSDTGVGIPKDKYDTVFERFAQLNPGANKMVSGTGLGLSIVKGLVELLGGTIWLESELNKGTTFYFSLPGKLAQASFHEYPSMEKNQKYYYPNKTILIVDDDPFNVIYIKELLSVTALTILEAENGMEAIQIAFNQLPDLVLMDIRLPDITGYEATMQIKQHNPNIKVIAQTAYAAYDDKQKAFESGCIDYISKPLKSDLFLAMIHKHLI